MELSHSADLVKGEIIGWYKRDEICQRSAYSCTIELRLKSILPSPLGNNYELRTTNFAILFLVTL